MAIEMPTADTARSIQHEPDQSWPQSLGIHARWPNGMVSYIMISADQFFGLGQYGAPLSGDAIVGSIKNMLAAGEPPREIPPTRVRNAKANAKANPKAKRRAAGRNVGTKSRAPVRRKRKGPS